MLSPTHSISQPRKRKGVRQKCSYYMWKQKFPVRQENKVERRMEVEELMVTNFPFISRQIFFLHHQGKQSSWTTSGTKGFLTMCPLLLSMLWSR
ncbi:hypothetical protein SLA2020_274750 [Shorea laevis]